MSAPVRNGQTLQSRMKAALESPESTVDLNLGGLNLKEVPAEVAQLSNLEALVLGPNPIAALPSWLPSLKKMHSLSLHRCMLENLPTDFQNLASLQRLIIAGNPELRTLPILPQGLKQLDMQGCGFESRPPQLSALPLLKEVYMDEKIATEDGDLYASEDGSILRRGGFSDLEMAAHMRSLEADAQVEKSRRTPKPKLNVYGGKAEKKKTKKRSKQGAASSSSPSSSSTGDSDDEEDRAWKAKVKAKLLAEKEAKKAAEARKAEEEAAANEAAEAKAALGAEAAPPLIRKKSSHHGGVKMMMAQTVLHPGDKVTGLKGSKKGVTGVAVKHASGLGAKEKWNIKWDDDGEEKVYKVKNLQVG
jgi:hypothetical protein